MFILKIACKVLFILNVKNVLLAISRLWTLYNIVLNGQNIKKGKERRKKKREKEKEVDFYCYPCNNSFARFFVHRSLTDLSAVTSRQCIF